MTLSCKEVRFRLQLEEEQPDAALAEHVQDCPRCEQYAGWQQRFDTIVRDELMVAVPADLSARLVALVPAMAAGVPIRTRRWYRQRTIAALIASVLVSVSVMLLALGLNWLTQFIGVEQIVAEVSGLPGLAMAHLYLWLPQSQYVVDTMLWLREPLQWLVVALLLWRAFDRIRPTQQELTSA